MSETKNPPTLSEDLAAVRAEWKTLHDRLQITARSVSTPRAERKTARYRAETSTAVGRRLDRIEQGLRVRGLPRERVAAGIAAVRAALERLPELEPGESAFSEEEIELFRTFNR